MKPIVTLPDETLLRDIAMPPGLEGRVWNWEVPPAEVLRGDLDRVQMIVQPMYGWHMGVRCLGDFVSLRVLQTMSAGVNDIRPLVPRGVKLCRLATVHGVGTSEVAMALLLASLRRIDKAIRDSDRRQWIQYHADALALQRVLLIGAGDIGEALRARIAAFGAQVTRVARTRREDALGCVHGIDEIYELLPHHDVVIVIVPLSAETKGMVDDRFFASMRDGALFMNVARGAIVQTEALVTHLNRGRIRAALDVIDPEPLLPDHPIWDCPNLIMTPHVGGMVPTARSGAVRVLSDQIARFSEGRPLLHAID